MKIMKTQKLTYRAYFNIANRNWSLLMFIMLICILSNTDIDARVDYNDKSSTVSPLCTDEDVNAMSINVSRRQYIEGQGTNPSATFSSSPLQGSLLVVFAGHRKSSGSVSISGSGWQEHVSFDGFSGDNNSRRGMTIWTKIAGPNEPSTINASVGSSLSKLIIQEYTASGGTFTSIDQIASNLGTTTASTSISTGSTPATSSSNTLAIGFMLGRYSAGNTPTFTNGIHSPIGSNEASSDYPTMWSGFVHRTTTGVQQSTVSHSSSLKSSAAIIAYKISTSNNGGSGVDCPGRVGSGLVALYDFSEGSGNIINDISGYGSPLNLVVSNPSNVSWLSGGCGLSVNSSTLIESSGNANKISTACKSTNEYSLEVWAKASNTTQGGPARIIEMGDGNGNNRNFGFGPNYGTEHESRVRTTGNPSGYAPALNGGTPDTYLNHYVVTRNSAGVEKFYINGNQIATQTVSGNLSNWLDTYTLQVANRIGLNRPWLGELYKIAIYNKDLSASEISTNYSESNCCGNNNGGGGSCDNGYTIDHYGAGCDGGSVNVNVPNLSNVNETTLEIVYKGCYPGTTVTASSSIGNISFTEVVVSGGSSSVYIYKATVSSGVTNITHTAACGSCSSGNGLQSLVVYAERNVNSGHGYETLFTERSGYCSIVTLTLPIPTSTAPRDVDLILPFSELTDDGRYLTVTATSNTGNASASETIYGPDLSLGSCCFDFVELTLINVPANSTYISIDIITDTANHPTGSSCGQSWVVSGTIFSEIECSCIDVTANAGPNKTICVGNTTYEAQLDGSASAGTQPYTYSWSPASGLNNTSIAQPKASPATTTTYTLTVTGADGCEDTDQVVVTVNNNYTNSGVIAGDEGSCGSFNPNIITSTILPSGGNGGTAIYVWQRRTYNCRTSSWSAWSNISGATSATYNPTTITQTTEYRRLARRTNCFTWVYSNTVVKEVVENYTSAGSIAGAQSQCGSYNPALITSSEDPSGGCGGSNLNLWRKREYDCSTDTWGGWVTISGATGLTYDPSTITVTTQFRRQSRRIVGCTPGWVYATPVTKTVIENITDTGIVGTAETMCGGYDPTTIVITTLPSGGCGADIEYRWYERTQDCATGTWSSWVLQPNSNTSTWVPGLITETTHYAYHARRGNCAWIPGPGIIKTVTENFTNAGVIAGDETMCGSYDPAPITSTSDPSGGCGTFWGIWQIRELNCSTNTFSAWANISGTTNLMTYDPPTISSTTEYRRLYTRTGCNPNYMITNTVTKHVIEHYTAGGTIAGDETQCGAYDPSQINSTQDPVGGCGGAEQIRWYKWEMDCNTGNWITPASIITGATGLSYDPPTITVSTRYRRYVRRSTACTGTNGTWMVSNYLYKYVIEDMTDAGTISSDQSNCGGFNPANITGTIPTGGCQSQTPYYIWQSRIGVSGAFTNITGNNTPDYNPGPITETTQYRRAVRYAPCPWDYSNIVTMTINTEPTIDIDDVEFCQGASVDLEPEVCVTFPDLTILRPLETSGWGTSFNSGGNKLIGDGTLCYDLLDSPNTSYQMMGLTSDPDANGSYNTIDYAMYILPNSTNHRVNIYENGVNRGEKYSSGSTSMEGSTFCIRRNGTTIEYLKDGAIIYTSTIASSADLYYDNSFHSSGAQDVSFNNIELCGEIEAGYNWSNGSTTKDISVSTGGTYTLTLTDINGCTSTSSTIITQNNLPNASASNNGPITCSQTNVILTATPAGMTYLWSGGGTNQNKTVTSPGIYTATITDNNGCSATATTTVTEDIQFPTADAGNDLSMCDGSATVTIGTSGVSDVTYQWSIAGSDINGATNSLYEISPSTTTTYTLTATGSNGCTDNDQVTVTVEPAPNVTATGETVCTGETATVMGTTTGGLGTPTYQWQYSAGGSVWHNIQGATSINYTTSALSASTYYRLEVGYTGTGCGIVYSNAALVEVEIESMPVSINAEPQSICINEVTTLSINENIATGGLIDYSTWTTGTGSIGQFGANGSTNENHRVNGIDPWGNNTVVWEARPQATSNADGGWNSSRVDVDNTKLYRFSVWVNRKVIGDNGRFYLGTRGYGTTNGVKRRSNGSTLENAYFYYSNPPTAMPEDEWMLVVGHVYPSADSGTSNHNDSGLYTTSEGNVGNIYNDYQWLPETTESLHRTYLFYCTDTDVRQQWVYPRIDVVDGSEPSIDDLLSGFDVNAGLGNGADWEWYTGSCGGASIGSGTSITVNPNVTTTYYVRGEGDCGNSDCQSITVTVNNPPSATAINDGPLTCANPSVILSAGPAGATYLWSNGNTDHTQDVTTSGVYSVTVTDSNGCTDAAETTISENTTPTNIYCERYRVRENDTWGSWTNFSGNCTIEFCEGNGLSDFQFDGGPDINTGWVWEDEDGNIDSEIDEVVLFSNIKVTDAGTYTGTLTNEFGCISSVTFNVIVNANPTADAGSNQNICLGSSTTLTATGGSSYEWDDPAGSTSSSIIVSPNVTTTYTVTVTDNSTCTSTADVTVTVNSLPLVSASNDGPITCSNTSVMLTASPAGMHYLWENGEITQNTNVSAAGDYKVTITDSNGCSDIATTTVSDDLTEPAASVNSPSICVGSGAMLSASGGVSYSWSTGGDSQSISVVPASTTDYAVTVTADNGCTSTAISTVTVNQPPNNSITKLRDMTCTHTLGYVYANAFYAGALSYADHSTYVSGGGACEDDYLSIEGVSPYSIVAHNTANVASPGNTYEFTFKYKSTGSGTKYARILFYDASWSYISSSVEYLASPSSWTDFTVTAVAPANAANVQTGLIIAGPNTVDIDCWEFRQQGNTAIYSNSFETAPPYSWSGPNGVAGSSRGIYISTPGTYTVTITDPTTGCTSSNSVEVIEDRDAPEASATNDGPLTCSNTSVDLTATSTTSNVNYEWSNGATTADTAVTDPGVYTVTVTDPSNGCTSMAETTVTANTTPTPVFCQRYRIGYDGDWGNWNNFNGECNIELCEEDGLWDIQFDGGPDNNTGWVWTEEDGNVDSETDELVVFSNIGSDDAGIYTGILTNEYGCTSEVNFEVIVNENPVVDAGIDQSICVGASTSLTASGGTEYIWDNSAASTTATINVNPNFTTTYTVTVTDNNMCSSTDQVTVTVDSIANMTVTVSDSLSCYTTSVQLEATPAGLNYSWSGPNGFTSSLSNPMATEEGIYNVTISDLNTSCTKSASIEVILKSNILINSIDMDCGDNAIHVDYTAQGTSTQGWLGLYEVGNANSEFIIWQWLTNVPGTGTVTFQNHNLSSGTYEARIFNGSAYELCAITSFDYAPLMSIEAGEDHLICNGYNANIDLSITEGTAPFAISWSGPEGYGSTSEYISVSEAGTYNVTVTDSNGCSDTDQIIISITDVNTNITLPESNCTELSSVFEAEETSGVTYAWDFAGATTADGDYDDRIEEVTWPSTYLDTTVTISLTVTTSNGCISTVTEAVTIYALPEDDIQGDMAVTDDESGVVYEGPEASSYEWSILSGDAQIMGSIDGQTCIVDFLSNDVTLQLIVTNEVGCPDTLYQQVRTQPLSTCSFYDNFDTGTYNNSNGSQDWSYTNWTEYNDNYNPSSGKVKATGRVLRMTNKSNEPTVYIERDVSLINLDNAHIFFDFRQSNGVESGDVFELQIYDGSSWTTIYSLDGQKPNGFYPDIDISAYASTNTKIRFALTNGYTGNNERIRIDDVYVYGDCNLCAFEFIGLVNENTCEGQCDGTIYINPDYPVTGDFNLSYDYNDTTYSLGPYTNGDTVFVSGLCAGTYSNVTISRVDNQCSEAWPQSLTIGETGAEWEHVTHTDDVDNCDGDCNGSFTVDANHGLTGEFTVSYTYEGTVTTLGPYDFAGDILIADLCPGTYSDITITGTETGCSDVWPDNIEIVIERPEASVVSYEDDNCQEEEGITTLQISGGSTPYSITWHSQDGTITGSATLNHSGQIEIEDLAGGHTYCITVTDSNGCTND